MPDKNRLSEHALYAHKSIVITASNPELLVLGLGTDKKTGEKGGPLAA